LAGLSIETITLWRAGDDDDVRVQFPARKWEGLRVNTSVLSFGPWRGREALQRQLTERITAAYRAAVRAEPSRPAEAPGE
jgi:hypothetical protein